MLIKVKIFAKCPSVPQLTSITFHKLTHKAFNKGLRIIVFCNIKEPSHYTDVPKVVPATGDELSEPRHFVACAELFQPQHYSHGGFPGAFSS